MKETKANVGIRRDANSSLPLVRVRLLLLLRNTSQKLAHDRVTKEGDQLWSLNKGKCFDSIHEKEKHN